MHKEQITAICVTFTGPSQPVSFKWSMQGWTLALAHSCQASANHSSLTRLASVIFHRQEIN